MRGNEDGVGGRERGGGVWIKECWNEQMYSIYLKR